MASLNHWLSQGLSPGQFMLQNIREPSGKVVPAGNIARFSLGLRVPVTMLSLQSRRMSDDDPDATFASGGRPGGVLCRAEMRNCKHYDLVRERELLARRGR
jgi:hypothetical protein